VLYLIATPIGNLADITYRAVETLQRCDLILCEDTRHSQILLHHYNIKKPLKSYHKFNEATRESEIIAQLKSALHIALISDGGTPGICDPGHALVVKCLEEGVPVTALPGACAAIVALTLTSMTSDSFQFIGFLPKKSGELKKRLATILPYTGTTICYESPHRLTETLQLLFLLCPQRKIAILRELTKMHEEHLEGTATELLSHFERHPPRGEIVLILSGEEREIDLSTLSPQEHVELLQKEYGLSLKEALKTVASLRKMSKNSVYQEFLRSSQN
jgi:16S rRNA (cytidine1402-2'-O)-methyltransferase